MAYSDEWRALSSRIRGLMQAGELHARFLSIRSNDGYGRAKRLREQCESVLSALGGYRDSYEGSIPPAASASIKAFVDTHGGLIRDQSGTTDSVEERVWAALVLLAA